MVGSSRLAHLYTLTRFQIVWERENFSPIFLVFPWTIWFDVHYQHSYEYNFQYSHRKAVEGKGRGRQQEEIERMSIWRHALKTAWLMPRARRITRLKFSTRDESSKRIPLWTKYCELLESAPIATKAVTSCAIVSTGDAV